MKKILKLTIFITFLVSGHSFADPLTDFMFTEIYDTTAVRQYFKKRYINEKGSLPLVGSKFAKAKGRIRGSSFTMEVEHNGKTKNILITNAHLLQGSDKKVEFHTVYSDDESYPNAFNINDDEVQICADQDIAIVDLSKIIVNNKFKTFGKYNTKRGKLVTSGQNNSPRGFYLMDDYGEYWPYPNYNMRPLFENSRTGETFNFVQMGNMFDLSCNYFPSSPEKYNGNAVFVPVTKKIKDTTLNPSPFVQKIFNNVNSLYVHMERVKKNKCRVELSAKLKSDQRVRTSYFSGNLVTPAGIVPGMSGSPLLINIDLRQSEYEIAGMVTSYDRRMQVSHFISSDNIKSCINKMLDGSTDSSAKDDGVVFDYSAELSTLYRRSKNYVEIPLNTSNAGSIFETEFSGDGGAGSGGNETCSAGDGGAGSGGDGGAGSGGDGGAGSGGNESCNAGDGGAGSGGCLAGDGGAGSGGCPAGDGGAGNGGKDDAKDTAPKSGLMYKGEHTLGFKCVDKDLAINLFANWESRQIVEDPRYKCEPITLKTKESLVGLLKEKFGKTKIKNQKASNKNLHSLQLSVKVSLSKKGFIELKISGSFYLKELDKDISFKDKVIISPDITKFDPYIKIKITDDNITNFFNKYAGGEVLYLDIKELFFMNLHRVYSDAEKSAKEILIENNIPKVFGSLKFKEMSKGSIPIELRWRK